MCAIANFDFCCYWYQNCTKYFLVWAKNVYLKCESCLIPINLLFLFSKVALKNVNIILFLTWFSSTYFKKKHCLFKVIEKIDCKDKVFLTSDPSLLAMRFKLSKLLWHCALLTMVFYCNLKWNVYFLTPACFGSKYTSCVFLWCNKLNLSFYLLLCLICILWQITLFIHVTGHLVNSESISSYCT